MPPKVKITKEDILQAAMQIVRIGGAQAINARTIASMLGCSTQPVFSNFANMEELSRAVVCCAKERYRWYMQQELDRDKYPPYKASGMAYLRFAKEEKELFKLLFMCDRSGENMSEVSELDEEMYAMVRQNTGLSREEAQLFHLEVWAFVHGIAAMFATGFVDLPWELVERMLTDCYQGLRKQYGMEETHGCDQNREADETI